MLSKIEASSEIFECVLEVASRKRNLSLVQKLFKRKAEMGRALLEAVKHGWGDVFLGLLDHGAVIEDDGQFQSLEMTVIAQEYITMLLRILQSRESQMSSTVKVECAKLAHEQGLESMVQLVESFKVF